MVGRSSHEWPSSCISVTASDLGFSGLYLWFAGVVAFSLEDRQEAELFSLRNVACAQGMGAPSGHEMQLQLLSEQLDTGYVADTFAEVMHVVDASRSSG